MLLALSDIFYFSGVLILFFSIVFLLVLYFIKKRDEKKNCKTNGVVIEKERSDFLLRIRELSLPKKIKSQIFEISENYVHIVYKYQLDKQRYIKKSKGLIERDTFFIGQAVCIEYDAEDKADGIISNMEYEYYFDISFTAYVFSMILIIISLIFLVCSTTVV